MTDKQLSRRRLLAAVGLAGALSGCAELTGDSSRPGDSTSATRTETDESTPNPTTADAQEGGELTGDYRIHNFVERDSTDLVLNGDVFRYNGLSSLLTMTIDPLREQWVDQVMDVARASDVNAIRCWGFPPTFDPAAGSVHAAPGEFDEEWFGVFDYTVARAKEAGVRLVVPLLQGVHVDASNERRNYAPSPATYGEWSDTADYTQYTKDFIEDDQANEYFKEYIEHLLTRENQYTGVEYRDEPTILVWECANELEFHHPDRVGDSLDFWYQDIGSFVTSLGAQQLVGTGMHGATGDVYEPWTVRCDFVQDHRADAIDVCSFHHYPVSGRPETSVRVRSPELTRRYMEHKVALAYEEVGKPVYCGEYGVPYLSESIGEVLVSRLETAEEASDVESNAEYPMAYPDQHDDGVLVTRREHLDWESYGLKKRNDYFRYATEVAADTGLEGVHWWRLIPARIPEEVGEDELPDYRMEELGSAILHDDQETFDVIQAYAERNAQNTTDRSA